MTSPVDHLLGRARLVIEPYTLAEINAAADRLAARRCPALDPHDTEPAAEPGDEQDAAAQDLRTLCETAVMSDGALSSLRRFVARCLPEPPAARVLGCILQLTEREDSARLWWQYAAGAGDSAATYCLYLHHMAHGERPEAEWWWNTQAAAVTRDHGEPDGAPAESTTTPRVPRRLKAHEQAPDLALRTAQVNAVLDYVPAAVAYVDDDLDLPLPDPDFTDRITLLTTPDPGPRPRGPQPSPTVTERRTREARVRPTAATPAPGWQWHDSGGAFGYRQRVGSIAAEWRRQQALRAFWRHCEKCADCDPSGIPCPAHQALW
ncbi:hypothetical protein [Streptomyces sp. NPDC057877]|uniref:hypothetical protein n=1 Tax=Streptomyces sp. NPDC057877 TaxID=3346269 RepID=UPI0036CBB7D7